MNAVFELRRSSGLTQTLLAELSGVSQTAISRYENGRRTPTLAMLSRLAEAVDLRAVVLFVPLPGRHEHEAIVSEGRADPGNGFAVERDPAPITDSTPASPSSR